MSPGREPALLRVLALVGVTDPGSVSLRAHADAKALARLSVVPLAEWLIGRVSPLLPMASDAGS